MHVLVLILAVVATVLLVRSGALSAAFSRVVIRVGRGGVVVERGAVELRAREHVADVLRAAGVTSGTIRIGQDGRVTFSREIPANLHQNLRNILLN